ncbi:MULTISPECIES: hypothetical protein [Bradyrhizobium]
MTNFSPASGFQSAPHQRVAQFHDTRKLVRICANAPAGSNKGKIGYRITRELRKRSAAAGSHVFNGSASGKSQSAQAMLRARTLCRKNGRVANDAMNRLSSSHALEIKQAGLDSLQHIMLMGDARGEIFEH